MKKIVTVLVAFMLMLTSFTLTNTPANSAIFTGGGSGSPVTGGGGTSAYNYTWVYSRNVSDFMKANGRTGSARPTIPMNQNSNGTFPKYGNQNGGAAVIAAAKAMEPKCFQGNVKAVFMVELTVKSQIKQGTGSFNFYIAKRQAEASNAKHNTWDKLLALYKRDNPNVDQDVIRQLQAKGTARIPDSLNIICVTPDSNTPKPDPDNPPPTKDKIEKRWVDDPRYRSETDVETITCPAATNINITRQINARKNGVLIDPIGENNLHNQATTKETPFYTVAKGLVRDRSYTPAQYKRMLEQACAQSTTENKDLTLTKKNKEGLAEGGVLNVQQTVTNVTFTSSQSKEVFVSCRAYEEQRVNNGPWRRTGNSKTCGRNYPQTRNQSNPMNNLSNQTSPKPNGFWQIISVHCNKDEFDEVVRSTGAKVIQSTENPDGTITALAYSKTYKNMPKYLDFGDTTNPKQESARTGNLAFYNKECGYKCIADNGNSPVANIRDNAPQVNGQPGNPNNVNKDGYGAVSGEVNTNNFEFFRDNEPKNIKVDVWYPANRDGVSYNPKDNTQNKTTTVIKWKEGTPNKNTGGQFTMFGKVGSNLEQMFTGPQIPPTTQLNAFGDTDILGTTKSQDVHTLRGIVNEYEVKANWASEADKPHKFNFKWEYVPNVRTDVPNSNIGFEANGDASHGTMTKETAQIEGKCYAQFGTNNTNPNLNTVKLFQQYTGAGTTNVLDDNMLDPSDNSEMTIRFVRSTSE